MSNKSSDLKFLKAHLDSINGSTEMTSKQDNYLVCPNCSSFAIYRDLKDNVNSCHRCGFTHLVGIQTIAAALADMKGGSK